MESDCNEKYNVSVYAYDLSKGLMKTFSKLFLGNFQEGIYHTSIVIYGVEYYYGGGIKRRFEGCTPYGIPDKAIQIGMTKMSKENFENYLDSIQQDYSSDKYDIVNNNCNHFVNRLCLELTNNELPEYITKQIDVLNKSFLGNIVLTHMKNKIINDN